MKYTRSVAFTASAGGQQHFYSHHRFQAYLVILKLFDQHSERH